jgi:hypothetical protein
LMVGEQTMALPRQVRGVLRMLFMDWQASAAGPSWQGKVGEVAFGHGTS